MLFDVDGTLIDAGGAGRRAVERAFRRHLGEDRALAGLSFQGLTDPVIVRLGLARAGIAYEPRLAEAILASYLEALAEEVPRTAAYRVHPGVTALLATLAAWDATAVGLGTGNLEDGARLKLRRAGLAERFAFGGFGSDAEERAALLRIGAMRGAQRLGIPLADCRVVVVGDTARDVAAAAAIGAACLAVRTGGSADAALRAAGPCTIVDTLAAPEVLDALAGAGSRGR